MVDRGRDRRLHWIKISQPDRPVPVPSPDVDLRVLIPLGPAFDGVADELTRRGVTFRRVGYLVEDEEITGTGSRLRSATLDCRLVRPYDRTPHRVDGPAATAAADAFDLVWQAHGSAPGPAEAVPAAALLPVEWLPLLPYPNLNPAQAEAIPAVLTGTENLLVVAPTGAGKTAVGMVAALRAIRGEGRKAAWLVPQRSLTEELDRDLDLWRRQGLRVERLSGEHTVDVDRIAAADLWVATTEKFEVICRQSSLKEALADVGVLVVDEVHLLGEAGRGPVLEALLARMRDGDQPVRLVALSATVSNATEIADWLRARLLRIGWRPTRLTWQLPKIPDRGDWNVAEAARTRLTAALVGRVTGDGGSTLVFCGSKRNVRRTALVIAGQRGATVAGVHPDDVHRLYEVCRGVGIGLHYTGWEHRRRTEDEFRDRRLDVLVSTSTLAAGVNLPARAVIIRDTQVGLEPIDVATVQQMIGRAGRLGAGEREGWAFLVVDARERALWQSRLVTGHTVRSQIQHSLPDHVLGEVVQGRVASVSDARRWWVQTLAHHQGSRSTEPLGRAIASLTGAGYLADLPGEEDEPLVATSLGALTARLMVSTVVGEGLRRALTEASVPSGPEQAEWTLIDTLATHIPKLVRASAGDEVKPAVAELVAAAGGVLTGGTDGHSPGPGDLARASLLAFARDPGHFRTGSRVVSGIPYAAMYPIFEEAPRYLHWLGGQGLLGTLHPWCAIVAADLGRRIRWRRLGPVRGAGRLLWMCEQLATPAHLDEVVPQLWAAATARGLTAPDWRAGARPVGCRLDEPGYRALLRDRATGGGPVLDGDQVRAVGPAGAALVVWSGQRYRRAPLRGGTATLSLTDLAGPPAVTPGTGPTPGDPYRLGTGPAGAALFTWRGDHLATGWLTAYARTAG